MLPEMKKRHLNDLESVVLDLLRMPQAPGLLKHSPTLVRFLTTQGWPETEESTLAPESLEAEEAAEISNLAEQALAALTPEQAKNLTEAMEAVCPGAGERLGMMLPGSLAVA